jgi:membrane protease YdiL (CAAX protease family)
MHSSNHSKIKNKMKKNFILSHLLVAIVLAIVIYFVEAKFPLFDAKALWIGNIMLFGLSLLSLRMIKTTDGKSAQGFVNGVYTSSLMKIVICSLSILLYVLLNKQGLHKPTVFSLLGMYFFYTMLDGSMLSNMNKRKK